MQDIQRTMDVTHLVQGILLFFSSVLVRGNKQSNNPFDIQLIAKYHYKEMGVIKDLPKDHPTQAL